MARNYTEFEAFEAKGVWWLPGQTAETGVAGTLTFHPDDGLKLDLIGSLSRSESIFQSPSRFEIILGLVHKSPLGSEVTLVDCFRRTFSTSSPGLSVETYRANKAFIGEHFDSLDAARFGGALLCPSRLWDWVGKSGLALDIADTNLWRVEYRPPQPHVAQVGSVKITLELSATTNYAMRHVFIEESAAFSVSSEDPMRADTISAKYANALQNFLSFATDHPNAMLKLSLIGRDPTTNETIEPPRQVALLYAPIFYEAPDEEPIFEHEMLFTLRDVKEFSSLIVAWFELHTNLRGAFEVFFAHIYRPARYVEPRFEAVLQSLLLYSEVQFKLSSKLQLANEKIVADFRHEISPSLREFLESRLRPYDDELVSAALHEILFEKLPPSVISLISNSADDLKNEALKTYHQIKDRAQNSPKMINGASVHWLTERLGFVFKSLILLDLGFTESDVIRLLNRNRRIGHLRALGNRA